jgi:hypothetical protein
MTDKKTDNRLTSIALTVVIVIAAMILIYTNLPKENSVYTPNENSQQSESEIIFTLRFDDQELKYSLNDLENLEAYTCNATIIKTGFLPELKFEGPNEYTGVIMSTLLNEIGDLPVNYSINVISTDINTTYNLNQIKGKVDIYDSSGLIIDNGTAIMILAYKIDGEYFTQEGILPLRIVFCNENMTSSRLWAKMVKSIEIIEH